MENNYNPKKVLVLNGSPKRQRSYTMLVTNSFLSGLNEDGNLDIEILNVSDLNIKPCTGCLSCWGRTKGECVIKDDDIVNIKAKILAADIIIASYPLYFFQMPGTFKVLTDRLLQMMETYKGHIPTDDGNSYHGLRYYNPNQRFILISSCAYTDAESAYKPLVMQYDYICGKNNYTKILVSQTKTLKDLGNENKTNRYLVRFNKAGKEFRQLGYLTDETLKEISKPPFTNTAYKVFLEAFWNEEEQKGKNGSR